MALGDVIARLSVQLGLDTAAFEKGSRKAGSQADALGNRMEKMGHRVGTALKVFAAAATVGAIGQLIKRGLEHASALGEQAQQLGVTTDALQEYRYAATQVGISQEAMDAGLAKLTKSIGEAAAGGKKQAAAFKELGVAVKDTNGNVLDAGAAIPLLADGFEKLKSPAERARLETILFGKAGQQLDTMLAGGSAAINKLRDAAHSLGIVLSEEQIQNADRTADKLAELKTVLEANIAGAVASNAGAIIDLANALARIAVGAMRAATAIRVFGLQARAALEQRRADLWFAPAAVKAEAQGNADRANVEARRLSGTQDRTGGFRDYNAAPIPGFRRGGGRTVDAALGIPDVSGGGSDKKPKKDRAGSSGPSAEEINRRFNDQLAGYAQQVLSARRGMALSAQEQAEMELRGVELSRLRTLDGIKFEEEYSATQKERLVLEVERLADVERERIARDLLRTEEDEAAELTRLQNDAARERLQAQLTLAGTDAERQRLALDLLDLDQTEKRQALERVIASASRTDTEKALARAALGQLNANAQTQRNVVLRENETQRERFLRELDKTPDQINESLDRISIDGLNALNDGLVDAIMGAKSLGDVFKNVANQIIADLLRIQVQKAMAGLIGNILGAFSGGLGSVGIDWGGLAGTSSMLSSPMSGWATGTPSAPPGLAWVGERGPELVNFKGGERVYSNSESRAMGRGGGDTRISVEASPFFDVRVNGQIMKTAPAIANAGSDLAMRKSAYSQSRRLAA